MTAEEQARLLWIPHLAGARTVNELILRGGELWWEENGDGRRMTFELDEGSSMMTVLKRYLSRKRPDLLKELK